MKKKSKIILGITLLSIIVIIGILVINLQKNSKDMQNVIHNGIYNQEYNENYYTITYSTNYDNSKVLDERKEYEVVTEQTRLDEILDKLQSKEKDYNFDDDFFTDNNLLVIEAGINPEINKFKITNKKVDIIIYGDAPLTTPEDIWDFNVYLIPISKTVEDINIELLPNPDKVF